MRFHPHEPALQDIGLRLFVLRFVAPAARFICGSWVWALACSHTKTTLSVKGCQSLSFGSVHWLDYSNLLDACLIMFMIFRHNAITTSSSMSPLVGLDKHIETQIHKKSVPFPLCQDVLCWLSTQMQPLNNYWE